MHKAWSNIEEVPYCFSRSSVKFEGHTGQKIAVFDLNWAFPDCNSSLNSPIDLKWCTKLDVQYRRDVLLFSKVVHQISRSHETKKLPILTLIERFRTVTSVLMHRWIWNDAQSLMYYRRGALLFLAATKQLYEWYFHVRLSVRLSHLFDYVPIIVSSWNFQELSPRTRVRSMQKVKVRGQRSRSQRSRPNFSFPDCNSSLNSHMMMKWYI